MRMDRAGAIILMAIPGLIVFVGVSSSVSPWLDDLYSEIAIWVFGIGAVAGVLWLAATIFDWDPRLDWEVRASWKRNRKVIEKRAKLHAAEPWVAKELAERMLQEKVAREQMGQVRPPSPPAA